MKTHGTLLTLGYAQRGRERAHEGVCRSAIHSDANFLADWILHCGGHWLSSILRGTPNSETMRDVHAPPKKLNSLSNLSPPYQDFNSRAGLMLRRSETCRADVTALHAAL